MVKTARIPDGNSIIKGTSFLTSFASRLRGSPKNTIPAAFVKHNIAIVPTKPSAAMERVKAKNNSIPGAGMPCIIPAYIKNSLINPFNGGSPHIAADPIINIRAVYGIDLIKPPNFSMFFVCVSKYVFPAVKNKSSLNIEWFKTCNIPPVNPSIAIIGFWYASPSMPKAMPIPMIPIFSIL